MKRNHDDLPLTDEECGTPDGHSLLRLIAALRPHPVALGDALRSLDLNEIVEVRVNEYRTFRQPVAYWLCKFGHADRVLERVGETTSDTAMALLCHFWMTGGDDAPTTTRLLRHWAGFHEPASRVKAMEESGCIRALMFSPWTGVDFWDRVARVTRELALPQPFWLKDQLVKTFCDLENREYRLNCFLFRASDKLYECINGAAKAAVFLDRGAWNPVLRWLRGGSPGASDVRELSRQATEGLNQLCWSLEHAQSIPQRLYGWDAAEEASFTALRRLALGFLQHPSLSDFDRRCVAAEWAPYAWRLGRRWAEAVTRLVPKPSLEELAALTLSGAEIREPWSGFTRHDAHRRRAAVLHEHGANFAIARLAAAGDVQPAAFTPLMEAAFMRCGVLQKIQSRYLETLIRNRWVDPVFLQRGFSRFASAFSPPHTANAGIPTGPSPADLEGFWRAHVVTPFLEQDLPGAATAKRFRL